MNLLMLTKFYPYGTGEAFIENEIRVFSEYFEKIVIIACEVPKGESRVRNLPNNVISYRVDAGSKKLDAIKGNLKYRFSRSPELVEERNYCKGIRRKVFLYYFEAKSQRVYEQIKSRGYLDKITTKPFMLYSYWLFMTARVSTLIAKDISPEKLFSRAHGYDLYAYRNALNYLPYRKFFLNTFNDIFPCSDNGTQYLQKNYTDYSLKIRTAFLGTIDHGIGKSSSDGVFRIVSCSRISPEKRVEKIIEALRLLDHKNLCIEWHHIGGGPNFDKIRERCSDIKNIKCILCGDISNSEVLRKYTEEPYDLFINVSSTEGLPVSIMEAISFGIPVIATDVGGTNEIVLNGMTGELLNKEFNNIDLANAILRFFDMNKSEYMGYRDKCRLKWEKSFQAQVNYKDLCEQLIGEDAK